MENRIFDAIIIGAGPAGIFTALELTHLKPESKVLIVDMGRAIAHRTCPARTTGKCVHCDPCGIVHGWAGAGACWPSRFWRCSAKISSSVKSRCSAIAHISLLLGSNACRPLRCRATS